MQGFGSVGSVSAELFHQHGAKVVAVQDQFVTLYHPDPIDIPALIAWQQAHGRLRDFPGVDTVAAETLWSLEYDILIPAALEGQITAERASFLRCRLILEGVNGPTLSEADDILQQRGIIVIPDVIANAVGVTVSYFEWVQGFSSFSGARRRSINGWTALCKMPWRQYGKRRRRYPLPYARRPTRWPANGYCWHVKIAIFTPEYASDGLGAGGGRTRW